MTRLLLHLRSPDTRVRRSWTIATSIITGLIVIGIGILAWPATLGGKATWVSVSGTSMEPNYSTGDLVLAWDDEGWQIGDVILYGIQGSDSGLIVHRLVEGNATDGWYAQGDNKPRIDPWLIPNDSIGGREILHVPGAGTALTWVRSPQVLAIICGLLVFWAVLTGPRHIRRRLQRFAIDEHAVVAGRAGHTVDLHVEGGRFSIPLDAEVSGDVPVEVWLKSHGAAQIARGVLSVRYCTTSDDNQFVGGPIAWESDNDREFIDEVCRRVNA